MFRRSPGNKLNAKRTIYAGRKYASKLEARVAMFLDKHPKIFPTILEQQRIHLVVGGLKVCDYVIDFIVTGSDGVLYYVEAKGFWTDVAKIKVKLFLALNPSVEYRVVNDHSLKMLLDNPQNLLLGVDCHTQKDPSKTTRGKTLKGLLARK